MPVIVVDHSIVQDCLMRLRDARTGAPEFRRQLRRIALLLVSEALRDLVLRALTIETPMGPAAGGVIPESRVVFVPVLRAGLGMLSAALDVLPAAAVGIVGVFRDEKSFAPHEYYHRLPGDLPGRVALILDPMLATGGTLDSTIGLLKRRGAGEIRAVTVVAAPEGVSKVENAHPEVRIYTASIDKRLNDRAYIVPGLGDAGDRIFNTISIRSPRSRFHSGS